VSRALLSMTVGQNRQWERPAGVTGLSPTAEVRPGTRYGRSVPEADVGRGMSKRLELLRETHSEGVEGGA
jgi:hypothetical protein